MASLHPVFEIISIDPVASEVETFPVRRRLLAESLFNKCAKQGRRPRIATKRVPKIRYSVWIFRISDNGLVEIETNVKESIAIRSVEAFDSVENDAVMVM